MKKLIVVITLLLNTSFYGQEKTYYTEDFKELPSADNAIYYSTHEDFNGGTQRKTYYIDGTIKNSAQFSNIKKGTREGISETWFKNGVKESVTLYKKNKLEGTQTRYYESGKVKRTEKYENDSFINGTCYDENGNEIDFFPYFVRPEFPGGLSQFYKHVARSFKVPNNTKGTIKVKFVVQVDGTVSDFEILKGLNQEMNAEALRVLLQSPAWIPGKVDGKVARISHSIPITIR